MLAGICPATLHPPGPSPRDELSITQRGSSHRGREDEKEEEEEVKRYQEFQNRQVQSLLELREAQADAEAERRMEHLRQVRGFVVGRESLLLGQTCHRAVSPAGYPCLQALQRLREIVLEAHTTQVKKLKEMNDRWRQRVLCGWHGGPPGARTKAEPPVPH